MQRLGLRATPQQQAQAARARPSARAAPPAPARTPERGAARVPSAPLPPSPAAAAPFLPRRALLLAAAALLAAPRPSRAAQAPAKGERPAAAAVREYGELEARGKGADAKSLDALRLKYGLRRGADGRVSVRSNATGRWLAVRLDMEVPGTLLLREEGSGVVSALETASLAQVDLSDDTVVLMLFADGAWEREMATVDVRDADEDGADADANGKGGKGGKGGGSKPLTLTEKEFREVVGLLKQD